MARREGKREKGERGREREREGETTQYERQWTSSQDCCVRCRLNPSTGAPGEKCCAYGHPAGPRHLWPHLPAGKHFLSNEFTRRSHVGSRLLCDSQILMWYESPGESDSNIDSDPVGQEQSLTAFLRSSHALPIMLSLGHAWVLLCVF